MDVKNNPTTAEYFEMCAKHDWTFQYSDDYSVYLAGENTQKKLSALADTNEKFQKIYDDWYDFVWAKKTRPELKNY